MEKNRWLSCVAACILLGSVACGGTEGGGSPSSTEDEIRIDSADITTKHLKRGGRCSLDIERPVIDAGDAAVNEIFAKAIPATEYWFCHDVGVDEEVVIGGGYTVSTNRKGVLSLVVSEVIDFVGAAHPNVTVRTFNFALEDGSRSGRARSWTKRRASSRATTVARPSSRASSLKTGPTGAMKTS